MISLRLGDCLKRMSEIEDKSIDLILCDLPYGTTRNKWDIPIDLKLLWKQYNRIIKDNGAILLFAQTPFDKVLGCSNLEMLRYEFIWEKDKATGFLNAKKMPLKVHENILVFYKKLPTYNPQMRTGFKPYKIVSSTKSSNYGKYKTVTTESKGERYPIGIIKFNRDKDKLHPTQKPVSLLEWLIKTYTNEDDLVLDNCMGVGSTAIACKNTKRNFIGIEIEKKYFEIAKERLTEGGKID